MAGVSLREVPIRNFPPAHEYWEKPPQRQQGNKRPEEIYVEVGKALTIWENLESTFAMLFGQLMDIHAPSVSAGRVYGSIVSPSARRDALNMAAASYFAWRKTPQDIRDDYATLMAHLKRATGPRNHIAHGAVSTGASVDGSFFLLPGWYNSNKKADPTELWLEQPDNDLMAFDLVAYAYTSKDIADYADKFEHLDAAALTFVNVLFRLPRGD